MGVCGGGVFIEKVNLKIQIFKRGKRYWATKHIYSFAYLLENVEKTYDKHFIAFKRKQFSFLIQFKNVT